MLSDPARWLLAFSLLVTYVLATENAYPRCNCDEEISFWSLDGIMECQRVSDFLIAIAYFSIPVELLYFISCSNFPFKWVLCEFIAFIVLCGMTHFLNGWTYGPHSFQLALSVTVFKILTALVSCATAITLFTLIPLLLKVKVRELMLKKKAWDLDREVGIIRRQKEAGWHVHMLTQEIRKSLDRHTILYTTIMELSKTLALQNCAVWMPNEDMTEMILAHQSKGSADGTFYIKPIPCSDPDVRRVKDTEQVMMLSPDSAIGVASSGGVGAPGCVVAVRMPMLRVSNFNWGTPQLGKACYGILVLVASELGKEWIAQELEIIQVVADQVAVAISHAAVLEESQLTREKLAEQNNALQMAQKNAMMASQARNLFQRVVSSGMRRPMHTILGLLSVLQEDELNSEQKLITNTMMKTNNVLSVLVNDVMDDLPKESGRFPQEMKAFRLYSLVREASCLAKCLSVTNGYGFTVEVDRYLPNHVVGDERRVLQVILHMVGNLLDRNKVGSEGSLRFRVFAQPGKELRGDRKWATWTSALSDDCHIYVRFEVEVVTNGILPADDCASSSSLCYSQRHYREAAEGDLGFQVCQNLVELMQGNIWVFSNQKGCPQSMVLVLRFQLQPSTEMHIPDSGESSSHTYPNASFNGLQVLLADADIMNRAVTRKMLEKLGCSVTAVSSGYECLSALGPGGSPSMKVVFLDLDLHDIDGYEVVTRIRKLCSRSWPLVVALAASEDKLYEREKMEAVGINGAVLKPVLLDQLVDELQRVLWQASKDDVAYQDWC